MTNNIFVVGPLSIDYLVTKDGNLHEAILGGGAAYGAAGARLSSDSVSIISEVSSDFPVTYLKELNRFGIETANIFTREFDKTTHQFRAYDLDLKLKETKVNTVFAELGRTLPKALLEAEAGSNNLGQWELDCQPRELPAEIAECQAVHFAGVGIVTIKRHGRYVKRLRNPFVSFDPPTSLMKGGAVDELKLALHDVDIFLVSERQCAQFIRSEQYEVWDIAERFTAMGPSIIVVKRGERGQVLFAKDNNRRWFIPAYPSQLVDVTGVGHTYSGAFIAEFAANGGDAVRAACVGSAAASLAIEGVGHSFPLGSMPGLTQARSARIFEGVQRA